MNFLPSFKKSLFFVLMLTFSIHLNAQYQPFDTLKPVAYFKKHLPNSLETNPDSIRNYYYETRKIAVLNRNESHELLALTFIADFYAQQLNTDSCQKYSKLADTLFHIQKKLDQHFQYKISSSLTNNFYLQRNYAKTAYYAKKVVSYLSINSPNSEIEKLRFLDYLSTAYMKLEIFDSLDYFIQESDKIISNIKRPPTTYILRNYWKKGHFNYIQGRRNEAINTYLQAILYINDERPAHIASNIYIELANLYYITREFDKAIKYYHQAINIYEKLYTNVKKYNVKPWRGLFQVYSFIGKYEKALYYLKKSLLFRSDDDPGSMYDYLNQGILYMRMDSLDLADSYFGDAFRILDKHYKSQPLTYAEILFYYAHFKIAYLHDPDGVTMTKKALSIYKKHFGTKHTAIADCYEYLGKAKIIFDKNPDEALKYFQKALIANDITFNNNDIYTNPDINNTLSKKYLLNILIDKANALKEKITKHSDQKNMVADMELMNNTLLLAIQTIDFIRTSFTSVDSKLKMNEKTASLYAELISSSLQLYQITGNKKHLLNAYEYTANSKTATLNGLINEDMAKITAGVPKNILEREKELRIQKGELDNQLRNLEQTNKKDESKKDQVENELFKTNQEIDLLTASLEKEYKNYYQLKYKNESLGVVQLQKHLTKNQVVLEYFVSDTTLIAFTISKDSFDVNSAKIDSSFLSGLEALTAVTENESFSHFNQKQFESFKNQAYTLYTKLITPSKAYLKDKELIIIPDKELLSIPFEILLTYEAINETNYRNLPYLINNYPISYAYSSEWLFNNYAKERAKNGLLAIVPSYDKNVNYENIIRSKNERGDVLVPIPAALEEAKNIAKTFKGDILEAEDATETNFKKIANKYSVLHFAMHAVIDNQNPMFSKLVFTPEKLDSTLTEDNMLNTYEVFNLDLNAQMVVLSSCKSGYGKIQKGEGILNMARGFIFAGCPTLVITLWSIDDMASADLMSFYYNNLAEGMNKAKAMQMAKIKFLKNADPIHAHPHFWASHILIGDTQKLMTKSYRTLIYLGLLIFLIIVAWGFFRKKINQALKGFRQPVQNNILSGQQ